MIILIYCIIYLKYINFYIYYIYILSLFYIFSFCGSDIVLGFYCCEKAVWPRQLLSSKTCNWRYLTVNGYYR